MSDYVHMPAPKGKTAAPEWKHSRKLIAYEPAVKKMEQRVQEIMEGKKAELIWLLEHPPLYSAGTSAKREDLLDSSRFPVYKSGRGGEYTYHGPGQRIIYLMLDVKRRKADLRLFIRTLEQWVIVTLSMLGVDAFTREGAIGIWVNHNGAEKKIAAIGIRLRHWVSFHGISINLNPDLDHYDGIIPCGINTHGVTSLVEIDKSLNMAKLDAALKESFPHFFPC